MNDRNRFALAASTLVLGVAAGAPALACPDQVRAEADAQARQAVSTALRAQQPLVSRPAAATADKTTLTRCATRKCSAEERQKQVGPTATDSATVAEQQRLMDAAKARLAKNG